MSIEEKLKNHNGSKRDFKRYKIHTTMNKVFFLLTLLLSTIITAQSTEEIDDSDLPTYSKYVLDSDVNQINNFINSKGAYATRIINNGGRNFTVSYAILNTGQSFTTTYDYSQKWKPSMDEYEIDMNYLRAQKIEKAEKERKKKLEIVRRAAEFKKNHPLSNLDPYEIKKKIDQILPSIENLLKLEFEKQGIEDVTKFDVDCVVREDDKKTNNAYLRIRLKYETPYKHTKQTSYNSNGGSDYDLENFSSNLSLFFKSGKGMRNLESVKDFVIKQLLKNKSNGLRWIRENKEDALKIKEEDIKEKEEAQILKNRIDNLDNMESVFYSILNDHSIMRTLEVRGFYIDDQYDFKKTLESAFNNILSRRLRAHSSNWKTAFKGKTGGKFKSLQITQTGKKRLNKLINSYKSWLSYGLFPKLEFHKIDFNVKIIDGKGKWLNSFNIRISIDVNYNLEIIDFKSSAGLFDEATKI